MSGKQDSNLRPSARDAGNFNFRITLFAYFQKPFPKYP